MTLRDKALKEAQAYAKTQGSQRWIDKLGAKNPKLKQEIEDLIVEWLGHGPIREQYPHQRSIIRFLENIDEWGAKYNSIRDLISEISDEISSGKRKPYKQKKS